MDIKELAISFNKNFCGKKVKVYLISNEILEGEFYYNEFYNEVNLTIFKEKYRTRTLIPLENIKNIKLLFK